MENRMTLDRFLNKLAGGWSFSHSTWVRMFGEKLRGLKWEDREVEVVINFCSRVEGGMRIYVWKVRGVELPSRRKDVLASYTTFEVEPNENGFTIIYRPKSYSKR